jgi:hypothetical protein
MANALLGWLNQFASGTVTGSSTAAELSAANLGNDQPSIPWQSTGTTEYVILDAGASVDWGGFGLFASNLTATAQVRWRVGTNDMTNLCLRSETFENATWAKGSVTVTSNALASPDGAVTADKLVETATTTTHVIAQNFTVVDATTYTFSVFVKAGERTRIRLRFGSSGSGGTFFGDCTFNLATGAIMSQSGVTAAIADVGSGWYRISATDVTSGTALAPSLWLMDATSATTYAGDGTSGLYLWGAQLEESSAPTGYVATTSAAVTALGYEGYDSYMIAAGIVAGYGQSVLVPPATVTGRYCRLDLIDSSNPDGYVRIGSAFAGPMSSPAISIAPNAGEGWQDSSTVTTSKGGQEYVSIGAAFRVLDVEFANLTDAELYTVVHEIDRAASLRSNVLLIPDPDSAYLQRSAIFGRITSLDPPVRRYPGMSSKRWRIKERK